MEKKQFSPFSLPKCYWRFCVSQAPHDFGQVFNQCLVGETKDQEHLCSSEWVQWMPTVICNVKLRINTFPSIKRPAWHRALPNRAGGAKISVHCFSPVLWSSADGRGLGAPSLNNTCTKVQSQKEHLFYKKTHCKPPLTNCSCWKSRLRARQHLSAPLLLRALC